MYIFPNAMPAAVIPAPTILSFESGTLAALGGAVAIALLCAAAVRLVRRRQSRATTIRVVPAAFVERAA